MNYIRSVDQSSKGCQKKRGLEGQSLRPKEPNPSEARNLRKFLNLTVIPHWTEWQ